MRCLSALVLLAVCPSIYAQFSGRITGQVLDASGAAVPGADVRLALSGGARALLSTKTSNDGVYHFIGVRAADYDLTVEKSGFITATRRGVTADPAIETTVPAIKLELATVAQSIDVSATVQSVETSNAEISGSITMEEVQKLPLLDRDPLQLIQTQPGVISNGNSPTVINGMRTSFANMTLDGINIQDNYIRDNALDYTPNLPRLGQVHQMTLVTSNQNAVASGGSAQLVMDTPSGTNQFHGNALWYNRNNYFSAADWFNNQAGIPRSFLNQNTFGGSIGGPVLRDKLFFYLNYEATRQHATQGAETTVLTPSARQGLFTYVASTGANRGKLQTANLLTLRHISIDPYMQNLLNQVPTTINNFDVGDSTAGQLRNTAGYRFNQRANNLMDNATGRLDYNFSTRNAFSASFEWNRQNTDRPDGENDYSVIPKYTNPNHGVFLSTSWRWTPTARLTNELRGGFNLTVGDFLTSQQFGPYLVTGMIFSDPVNEALAQGRATNTYSVSDNAGYQHGRHFIQFGFFTQQVRVHSYDNSGTVPTYTLAMGTGQPGLTRTNLPGVSSTDLDNANLLLASLGGYIDSYSQSFNVTSRTSGFVPGYGNVRNFLLNDYDLFVQDQWKIAPRLTATIGLRWDLPGAADEANGLSLLPVIPAGQTIVQTLLSNATLNYAGAAAGRPWYNRSLHDFAPNLGLAWDVFGNGKTALRAGYSIAYVNDATIIAAENMTNANAGLQGVSSDIGLSNTVSGGVPRIPVPPFQVPLTLADNYVNDPFNTVGMINPNLRTPYVQMYSVGVQHEYRGTIFDVRYVGNHMVGGYRAIDYNQVNINAGGFLQDFLRAQQNGFLAQARNGSFNPAYNSKIPGSQPLPVIGKLPSGGSLSDSDVINYIETGQAGQLAAVYQENGLNGSLNFFANPNALGADFLTTYSNSTYNSLQIDVRHRMKSGLDFDANYTFSKVLSDADGDSQSRFQNFLDINNPRLDRGRANFDLTHMIKASGFYDLPFGKGHRFHSRLLNPVIGGWSLGSIMTWQSGAPFSILSGYGTLNRADGGRSYYNGATVAPGTNLGQTVGFQMTGNGPYIIKPSAINPADGTGTNAPGDASFAGQVFYNPAAGTLGGLQRRMFSGPWTFDLDASLQKRIAITERQSLELRMEGVNVLNHPSFWSGDQNINSTTFGLMTSTFYLPRIMQFGVYYRF